MTAQPLAALLDAHGPALVLFARQWCLSPEDAVQDSFCKLAAQRVWPDDPAAWLFRAVRNRALDLGKRDRRRARREAVAAKPARWFAEDAVDGLDAAAAVAALEGLPADQREVIVGRLWGGLTLGQVAAVSGCSVSTAHRRYESGIAALREALGVRMSDDMERLAKFTPSAGTLDRDEVLFRIGRASVRTPRGWKRACGVLAVTQAVTIGMWLGGPATPPPTVVQPSVALPEPLPAVAPEPSGPPPALDPSSYLALSRSWNPDAPPPAVPAAGPSRPERPLTAGSRGELFN